jgi:hypothetical protein
MGLPQETLVAMDLDDVRDPDNGALLGWAAEAVATANSYTEITPSGSGLRILGTAHDLPDIHCKTEHPGGGSFELYVGGPLRFITVTGHRLSEAPNVLSDITSVICDLSGLPKPNGATDWVPPDGHAAAPVDLNTLDPLVAEQISKGTLNGVHPQKRGWAFFNVVRELHEAGHEFDAVLTTLRAHPNGVHAKYGRRLETELQRVWAKLGDNADEVAFQEPQWPAPLGPEALYGLAGKFLKLVRPQTEADIAGLLFQFLTAFGNVIGPGRALRDRERSASGTPERRAGGNHRERQEGHVHRTCACPVQPR